MPLPNELNDAQSSMIGLEEALPNMPLDLLVGVLDRPVTEIQRERLLGCARLRRRICARLARELNIPSKWSDTPALRVLTCAQAETLEAVTVLAGGLCLSGEICQIIAAAPRAEILNVLGPDGYELVLNQSDQCSNGVSTRMTASKLHQEGEHALDAFLMSIEEDLRRALCLRFTSDRHFESPNRNRSDFFELAAENFDA